MTLRCHATFWHGIGGQVPFLFAVSVLTFRQTARIY